MQCSSLEWFAGFGLILVIFLTCDGLFRYNRFLKLLRQMHAATWRKLGEPGLVTVEGSKTDRAMSSFVLWAEYRQLGDPALTTLGDSVRVRGIVNTVLALVLAVLWACLPNLNLGGLACFLF